MSLDNFNDEIKKKNLIGYWMIPNRSDGFREPQALFEPFLWKWAELYDALNRAVEYIRPEEAFRRFIGFQHPQLKMGTSHSLLMGGQMVRPREIAPGLATGSVTALLDWLEDNSTPGGRYEEPHD